MPPKSRTETAHGAGVRDRQRRSRASRGRMRPTDRSTAAARNGHGHARVSSSLAGRARASTPRAHGRRGDRRARSRCQPTPWIACGWSPKLRAERVHRCREREPRVADPISNRERADKQAARRTSAAAMASSGVGRSTGASRATKARSMARRWRATANARGAGFELQRRTSARRRGFAVDGASAFTFPSHSCRAADHHADVGVDRDPREAVFEIAERPSRDSGRRCRRACRACGTSRAPCFSFSCTAAWLKSPRWPIDAARSAGPMKRNRCPAPRRSRATARSAACVSICTMTQSSAAAVFA